MVSVVSQPAAAAVHDQPKLESRPFRLTFEFQPAGLVEPSLHNIRSISRPVSPVFDPRPLPISARHGVSEFWVFVPHSARPRQYHWGGRAEAA